ncbi:MAG TPA: type IV pilus secretin PilQ family protein [Nevskiaceae bacterium]|nr:type IV pilus secretin PilQ family protein [Nevskiaceae bacterium]
MNLRTIMTTPRPLLALALFLLPGLAAAQATRALQSLDFVSLEGERVLITLTLSEVAPEPVIFTIDKPARLSLDLPETRVAMAERYKKINIGQARSAAVAEAKGRTRVVIELGELVAHSVRTDSNRVYLQLENGASAAAPVVVPGSPAATPAPVAASAPAAAAIRNIDFRRGEKGEGRVVVTLSDPSAVVDVAEEGGKVVARFKNTAIADALARRLDVLDFATPVKFIDTRRDGINAEIVVTPVGGSDFEQVAYQSGELFTLELQPLTAEAEEQRRRQQPQYTGERISLSFQSVDIRSLLQIIADVAGTNMVVSDSVSGEIAMRLQNVPWDQALDIILRTKGLGLRQEGNVMLVAPLTELAEREKVELEAAKQKDELAPLRSELIQVNYAKAADMATLLKAGDSSVLSERGRVSIDERTNTLLVLETREKLAEIRSLVARLDIPVKQVLIESRIVIANNDYSKQLGARFGVNAISDNNGDGLVSVGGSANANDDRINDFLDGGFPVSVGNLDDRFNVSLPASATAGRIALAVLGSDYLVDLELSALQAEGRGEVISSPRVVTANAKQASIKRGVEIPYQEATSSGAASISFKEAVLSLAVTPQITPDDRIILDLSVTNNSVGENVPTNNGGSVPSIDKREVNTQVLVDNGQTVVLGGIYDQENRNTVTKVPLLGDVPLLGALFRNRVTVSNKDELLIFVTPKILREGLQVN